MANRHIRSLTRLLFGRAADDHIHQAYKVRVALFFVLVVIVIAAFWLFYQFTQTLYQLHLAEGERDRWQRPGEVIAALNLKEGGIVADVGCGVGYFSLKLAPKVAEHGSVLAEDILARSLAILWLRALLHHQFNIRVIHGDLDDPHLPKGGVDAVLIANSYHEFIKPVAMGHANVASRLTRAFSASPSFFRLPLGYPYDQAILIQWLKRGGLRYGRDACAALCVAPRKHSALASGAAVYGAKRKLPLTEYIRRPVLKS